MGIYYHPPPLAKNFPLGDMAKLTTAPVCPRRVVIRRERLSNNARTEANISRDEWHPLIPRAIYIITQPRSRPCHGPLVTFPFHKAARAPLSFRVIYLSFVLSSLLQVQRRLGQPSLLSHVHFPSAGPP